MGQVYLAEDMRLDRKVALKLRRRIYRPPTCEPELVNAGENG
jgi:hypothetical protein